MVPLRRRGLKSSTRIPAIVTVTARSQRPGITKVERFDSHRISKSILDYSLAALVTLPCLVIIGVAALLVRLTSRGPAIYSQSRLGRFGRPFVIYKLRTMYNNCESVGGAKWSNRGDPRVTPLGRILRKLHIDELPQLVNVWRGEMSLIGPRPERPEIVASLRPDIPGYDRRLSVLPGVTGFAQVHLPPDETTGCVRRKLVFDRYYVRLASWQLDVRILGLTALKVFGLRRLYARTLREKSLSRPGRPECRRP